MDQTGTTPPEQHPTPPYPTETLSPPPVGASVSQSPPGASSRRRAGWKVFVAVAAVVVVLVACCGTTLLLLPSRSVPLGDAIAVIHVDGVIAGTGSSYDGIVTPEAMIDQLDQAVSDPRVKAIVLRIDSPGGTVAASQEISTEVARAAEEKPVVASIGDVGASGAYMVASQCDEIIANPTSAVGSIGVITEIPNVAGLLDKLGIEFTVLTAGEYKDAGSPWRSMTPTETDLVQREVDIAYDEFIRIVAEGRELPEDEVRDMATGWAWSAVEAQEMGLVDTLGTFSDALERAADLGGIPGDYDVVYFDRNPFEDVIGSLIGISRTLAPLDSLDLAGSSARPAVPK